MALKRRPEPAFDDWLDGWISRLVRLMGIVGVGYEMFVDKLRNPTALLVFGGLATAKDVLQYRQIVKRQDLRNLEDGDEA